MVERRNFTSEEIESAWEKASTITGCNPDLFRQDYAGAWICKSDYGMRDSEYGWEVDHVRPLSKGGTYAPDNLKALHWSNNAKKGDDFPCWTTDTSSNGKNNIQFEQYWKI